MPISIVIERLVAGKPAVGFTTLIPDCERAHMFRNTLRKSLLALAIGATLTMTGSVMAQHGNRGNRGNVYRGNNFNRGYNNNVYRGNGYGRSQVYRPQGRSIYGYGNGYGRNYGYGGRNYGYGYGAANFNRNAIRIGGFGISW